MARAVQRERLEEAWRAFREVHFPALKKKTRAEYSACWRRVMELPEVITTGGILHWHRVRLLEHEGLSPGYADMTLHVLRTVVRRAALVTGDDELQRLVWQVTPLGRRVLEPRCPPRDCLARCLEAARSPAERCWLLLAGLAGLRVSELLGLKPDDWDPETGVLRVVRQRHEDSRKNRRPHVVLIDDQALEAALVWTIANHSSLRSRTGWHRGVSAPFLFPWGNRRVAGFLARLRSSLGADRDRYLPRGRGWHALRIWGATELARDGASCWDVQAWLGDASPDVACRYVEMVRGETAAKVSRLANRLREVSYATSDFGSGDGGGIPDGLR